MATEQGSQGSVDIEDADGAGLEAIADVAFVDGNLMAEEEGGIGDVLGDWGDFQLGLPLPRHPHRYIIDGAGSDQVAARGELGAEHPERRRRGRGGGRPQIEIGQHVHQPSTAGIGRERRGREGRDRVEVERRPQWGVGMRKNREEEHWESLEKKMDKGFGGSTDTAAASKHRLYALKLKKKKTKKKKKQRDSTPY